jgi:hypothetical protein
VCWVDGNNGAGLEFEHPRLVEVEAINELTHLSGADENQSMELVIS